MPVVPIHFLNAKTLDIGIRLWILLFGRSLQLKCPRKPHSPQNAHETDFCNVASTSVADIRNNLHMESNALVEGAYTVYSGC